MPAKHKYSPQLHEAFLVALESTGGFVQPACAIAGIPSSTVWYWLERGKSGDDRYAQLWADVIKARAQRQVALKSIVDAHAAEDPGTARWLLERTAPAEYGLREKVDQAAAEQLQAWLDAVMGHLDEVTRERVLAAVRRVTGDVGALDEDPEPIDVDAEVVERALPSGDTE
jgi:hypothetical protein